MKKPIKWTLIGLGIFTGVVIVAVIIFFVIFFLSIGVSVIREVSTPETKQVEQAEEVKTEGVVEEEQEIIGDRETEYWGKVPVLEWKIGKPIVFRNGLKLILNKVWEEKRLGYLYVVISVTLENTTDEIQDGIDLEMPTCFSDVWDSEDNRFSGSGDLTIGESIWEKIDSLSPGDNKKWPPGKELTGNIYFNVSGNTGGLMVELEYSEFIRPNVIYRYVLKDTEVKTKEEIVIPTELEAREKIEEGICELPVLSSDREFIRQVANWLPASWKVGMLVIRDDNPTRWAEEPQMHYYLMVTSQGGVLYVTWGVQNIYYYKSWTEIEEDIVRSYPSDTTDWASGYFITGKVWRNDPLWQKEELWGKDTFFLKEFWD